MLLIFNRWLFTIHQDEHSESLLRFQILHPVNPIISQSVNTVLTGYSQGKATILTHCIASSLETTSIMSLANINTVWVYFFFQENSYESS